MSDTHGAVWWSGLMTHDAAAAADYYGKVCGWTFSTMPMGGGTYRIGMKGDRPLVGIANLAEMDGMQDVPPHWYTYLAVDDVDRAVADTLAAGGRLERPVSDVADIGRIALLVDPTGARIGLMTPASRG
jgi:predicted enzyme related to lactoylglutathione lyase